MVKTAVLSNCGTFRYRLGRVWDDTLRPMVFIMLNPSTADAEDDDPTITRCIGFAKREGAGGIDVVNLFAYRSTDPAVLRKVMLPVGEANDAHIRQALEHGYKPTAAWGAGVPIRWRSRVERVGKIMAAVGVTVHCLGRTGKGEPRHPLMLRTDAPLEPYWWPKAVVSGV